MEHLDLLLAGLERELEDVCRRDRELVLEDVQRRLERRVTGGDEEALCAAFIAVAVEALAAGYRAGGLGRPLRRRDMEGKRHCDHPHHIHDGSCCHSIEPEGSD